MDLFFFKCPTLFGERMGNVRRCDRSEQFSLTARLSRDDKLQTRKALGFGLPLFLFFGLAFLAARAMFFDELAVTAVRQNTEFPGDEKVAGIAVTHRDDIPALPHVFYVLQKYQ